MKPIAYLDVSPLIETNWTGIPNVVSALAQNALSDPGIDWRFCYETIDLPAAHVRRLLSQRSGATGEKTLNDLAWSKSLIRRDVAERAACVFTNVKSVRRFFDREALVVWDLSPVLTPEFHNQDTINHHATRMRGDFDTSDHIFCDSRAAMTDVHYYFKKPLDQMSVIRLGAQFNLAEVSQSNLKTRNLGAAEKYVVVLGTLEPRKNGALVLEYIAENPEFSEHYRTVFVGRDGWLDAKAALLAKHARAGIAEDRVVFTGFVTEAEKVALIQNSAFCIYPSMFEGFGLPVLEAAALGKVTVCSRSSSMPEVAPESSIFFDPTSTLEFNHAMALARERVERFASSSLSVADVNERAPQYGWAQAYEEVARWVKEAAR